MNTIFSTLLRSQRWSRLCAYQGDPPILQSSWLQVIWPCWYPYQLGECPTLQAIDILGDPKPQRLQALHMERAARGSGW